MRLLDYISMVPGKEQPCNLKKMNFFDSVQQRREKRLKKKRFTRTGKTFVGPENPAA